MDPRAAGCLLLIRDGATLVRGVDDVLEALRNLAPPAAPAWGGPVEPVLARPGGRSREKVWAVPGAGAPPDDAALRDRIVERLGPSPLAEDQLIRDLGVAARTVAPALMDLELEGRVLRQPGGLLALAG
jgi:DNA processing protein